jgi:hypothetical protein
MRIQALTEPIPYASEQGIFTTQQGIQSGNQGTLRRDQGYLALSAAITWYFKFFVSI